MPSQQFSPLSALLDISNKSSAASFSPASKESGNDAAFGSFKQSMEDVRASHHERQDRFERQKSESPAPDEPRANSAQETEQRRINNDADASQEASRVHDANVSDNAADKTATQSDDKHHDRQTAPAEQDETGQNTEQTTAASNASETKTDANQSDPNKGNTKAEQVSDPEEVAILADTRITEVNLSASNSADGITAPLSASTSPNVSLLSHQDANAALTAENISSSQHALNTVSISSGLAGTVSTGFVAEQATMSGLAQAIAAQSGTVTTPRPLAPHNNSALLAGESEGLQADGLSRLALSVDALNGEAAAKASAKLAASAAQAATVSVPSAVVNANPLSETSALGRFAEAMSESVVKGDAASTQNAQQQMAATNPATANVIKASESELKLGGFDKTLGLFKDAGTVSSGSVTENVTTAKPSAHTPILEAMQTRPGAVTAYNGKLTMQSNVGFGQAQWPTAIAERAAWLVSQSIQSADIQLDPPELGPLTVKVHVQNDQAAVSFVVNNPQVKEALDQTLNKLKEMLQEQGMELVDSGVSDQSQQREDQSESDSSSKGLFGQDNPESLNNDLSQEWHVQINQGIDYYA